MKFNRSYVDRNVKGFDPKKENRIRRNEIRLLYHHNYYDGPLSGACLWRGKPYWFLCKREETVIYDLEPGDEGYVDPHGPVPDDWKLIFEHGYESLAELEDEDLNEECHCFRYMVLVQLTPEEWKHENRRQEAWRKYIGRHCDYDQEGKRAGAVGAEKGGGCDWDAYKTIKSTLNPLPDDLESRRHHGYFLLWEDEVAWKLLQNK